MASKGKKQVSDDDLDDNKSKNQELKEKLFPGGLDVLNWTDVLLVREEDGLFKITVPGGRRLYATVTSDHRRIKDWLVKSGVRKSVLKHESKLKESHDIVFSVAVGIFGESNCLMLLFENRVLMVPLEFTEVNTTTKMNLPRKLFSFLADPDFCVGFFSNVPGFTSKLLGCLPAQFRLFVRDFKPFDLRVAVGSAFGLEIGGANSFFDVVNLISGVTFEGFPNLVDVEFGGRNLSVEAVKFGTLWGLFASGIGEVLKSFFDPESNAESAEGSQIESEEHERSADAEDDIC